MFLTKKECSQIHVIYFTLRKLNAHEISIRLERREKEHATARVETNRKIRVWNNAKQRALP